MKNIFTKKMTKGGYTIIETMVSLSIFLVIILSGMSALLNANMVYNRSRNVRSSFDNLSFIMEDMSRNLRTGYNYRCVNDGDFSNNKNIALSCSLGTGIIFENDIGDSTTTDDQWMYKVEPSGSTAIIYKATGLDPITGLPLWNSMTIGGIYLDQTSSFSVLGAETPALGNSQQPLVNMRLSGYVLYKNTPIPFSLQTSVSQRRLDI